MVLTLKAIAAKVVLPLVISPIITLDNIRIAFPPYTHYVKVDHYICLRLERQPVFIETDVLHMFNVYYHLYLLLICLKTGMSQTEAKSRMHDLTLMVSLPKMS